MSKNDNSINTLRNPLKIGILGSTKGTSMQPIIDAIKSNNLHAEIVIVISNKEDSGILERAHNHNIHNKYISPYNSNSKRKKNIDFDTEVTNTLRSHEVQLVLMIGYMRIVSKEFCEEWKNRCLNVHPSLLPDFAKEMDLQVHSSVIKSGKTITGCTIHFVTEDVDGGPILYQEQCDVKQDDTPESLKKRVQILEGNAFIWAIKNYSNYSSNT